MSDSSTNNLTASRPGGWITAWFIATLLTGLFHMSLGAQAAIAQTPFDSDRFQGFLDSGEFAPAKSMINDVDDRATQDRLLAQLAQSQQQAGAFRQATQTLGWIQNQNTYQQTSSALGDSLQNGNGLSGFGGRGGGIRADFDPLMELIERTIEPDSWEALGGTGRMAPFESGVHVDAKGLLRNVTSEADRHAFDRLREAGRSGGDLELPFGPSLRYVSLTRLERALQQRAAQGLPPTETMRLLGGLRRIDYVFVYPETQELVIAGPAEPWEYDSSGRPVGRDSGQPLLWLDDLVACWRATQAGDGIFGCSIDPRDENLEATAKFLETTKATGKQFQSRLREALGRQDIMVHGIDPDSHAAHVLVIADYHMKLVGMGLETAVVGVTDLLTLMHQQETRPAENRLVRWWFTLDYDAIRHAPDRLSFAFDGTGAKVLSENEWLDATGKRRGAGKSEGPSRDFAQQFSAQFEALAEKYPVYADLRNVFDLAMLCGLISEQRLAEKIAWNPTYFNSPTSDSQAAYELEHWPVPKEVDTVMNARQFKVRRGGSIRTETFIGVSGGVHVDVAEQLSDLPLNQDDYESLTAQQQGGQPQTWSANAWFWDEGAAAQSDR